MTTPTVPPTTEPVEITCAIELDPLAPPCGTGLEGWGEPLSEPVIVCHQGVTIETVELAEYQSALAGLDGNSLGACPAVDPAPVPEVAVPQTLPVTGTRETVQASVAGSVLLVGVALWATPRLVRRRS